MRRQDRSGVEALGDGDVTVAAIIREGYRRYVPAGYWPLFDGDILVLEAEAHALSRLVNAAKLGLIHGKEVAGHPRPEDLTIVEAVVTTNSPVIGSTVEQLALRELLRLNLLALSRSGRRIAQRLRRVRFRDGDLLVLQGRAERINDKLAASAASRRAERTAGAPRNLYLPALILGVAMALVTTGTVSVALGFFGAAVAVLVFQLLTIQEA